MQDLDQLIGALQLRNWYAFAALSLMLVVQIARKAPKVRDLYAKVPDGWRWLPPIVLGAATAFVAAFQSGAPLKSALLQALGGAIGIGVPSMGGAALLKESPIPWDGGKGGAMLALIIFALPLLTSCAAQQKPACTQEALAHIVAACDADMRSRCTYDGNERPDPYCPAVAECKAKLEAWRVCK